MGFFDTLLGKDASRAANAAAEDQYSKELAAINGITNYGNQYADQFREMGQAYNPFIQGGTRAQNTIYDLLGLNGPNTQAQANAAWRQTPGYQAGLDTATDAVNRNASFRGMSNSGRALQELSRAASDYEDQRFGGYLDRLLGLGTQGMGAIGAQNATAGQGLAGQLATRQSAFQGQMKSAPTIGQGMVAGATAESQGLGNTINLGMNAIGMLAGGFGGAAPGGNYFRNMAGGGFKTPTGFLGGGV